MQKIIGGHLSISQGFDKMFSQASAVDANAIQIFISSNRSWDIKPISEEKKNLFLLNKPENIVVIAHASYLINLASIKKDHLKKSEESLLQHLLNCDQLNIPYLVLHPGSVTTGNKPDGLIQMSNSLNEIYPKNKIKCKILLENMAGQGSVLGSTFEELAIIKKESGLGNKIGFCLDTSHLFGYGYKLSTIEEINNLLAEFDNICGLENLFVVHLNDSKENFNSKKDRHENIGKGKIGLHPLQMLFNHQKLNETIFILETPWNSDDTNNYKEEIALLKKNH